VNTLPAPLDLLADPNIAFVLFMIGALGVAVELIHPNLVTGIVGSLALVLAFIGFGGLPVNVAGLLLLAFGFVLFVLEAQIVSHGLLTLGGIACVALGGSVLYTGPVSPTMPVIAVAPPLLIVVTVAVAVLMALIAVAALRSRRMTGTTGTVGVAIPKGSPGIVQAPLAPAGTAHLGGETWSARTADERTLPRDTPIRLVRFEGLTAIVEPDPDQPPIKPTMAVPVDRP
jgi:membrane-bound serine protease (ClpP class)